MAELGLPAAAFTVAYKGPAPTILIRGGADTSHEDRFVSQGRLYWDRGYAVALADLPGQELVQAQDLF